MKEEDRKRRDLSPISSILELTFVSTAKIVHGSLEERSTDSGFLGSISPTEDERKKSASRTTSRKETAGGNELGDVVTRTESSESSSRVEVRLGEVSSHLKEKKIIGGSRKSANAISSLPPPFFIRTA